MGEKKTRVTRLDKVRGMLTDLRSRAMSEKATAAIDGRYTDAIVHQEYEAAITACIVVCDEAVKRG